MLVPRETQDALIKALSEVYVIRRSLSQRPRRCLVLCYARYHEFYPEGPRKSNSLSRICAPTHFSRIQGLLDHTKGTVVFGGETDESEKYISPTIVKDVPLDDSLMSE